MVCIIFSSPIFVAELHCVLKYEQHVTINDCSSHAQMKQLLYRLNIHIHLIFFIKNSSWKHKRRYIDFVCTYMYKKSLHNCYNITIDVLCADFMF